MKKLLYLLVVIVVVVGGFYAFNAYIYNQKQGDSKSFVGYQDAVYVIDGRVTKLSNGRAESVSVNDPSTRIMTSYFGNELRTDIDGDGLEDVVFLLTENTGTTDLKFYVAGALNKGAQGYVGSQALYLGTNIAPQTTEKGTGRQIIVNYGERKNNVTLGKSLYLLLDIKTMQWGEVVQNFEGEADASKMTLGMKTWTWVRAEYGGDALVMPSKPDAFTLTFGKDGKFSATTDCNSMGGSYVVKGTSLTLSNIFSTKMFCEGSQESLFSKVLSDSKSYNFTGKGELVIDLQVDGKAIFK